MQYGQHKKSSLFISLISLLFVFISTQALSGTILVTNVLSNSVSLFNDTTLQSEHEFKVGYMPHEIVTSKDGNIALVSNFGDLLNVIAGHTITTLDIANGKILKTIELPKKSRPHGLAVVSESEALVTAQGIQSLLLIDFMQGTIKKTLSLPGAGAHMVLVDAGNHFAYVANTDSGSLCKINLKNFTIEKEVKIGREAEGLALTPQEDLLFVTDRKDNYIAVIKTKDLSLYKTIPTASGPVRVEMFNNGRHVLIINSTGGNAQIMDVASLNIIKSFKTTLSHSPLPVPINAAIRNDQKTAYITNSFANNITLVDLTTGKILKTLHAGYMPDGIALSPINTLHHQMTSFSEFEAKPIIINAPLETVWTVVKNVNQYYKISNGAVSAYVEGDLQVGKNILLELYKDQTIGKFIPKSNETISLVDDEHKILSWVKKLPDGSYTERFQLLQKVSDTQTRSSIVVRIPGVLGKMTKKTLGSVINKALVELNIGIKRAAEKTSK